MQAAIREYVPSDEQPAVALALRAWAPVFESLERVLGREIFARLHGNWRDYQGAAVRNTLRDVAVRAWVAEREQRVSGFVTTKLHQQRHIGEITMLAVDPDDQLGGVGGGLTEFATSWLRHAGMQVAMVDSGGDAGHAAARAVYENAGYSALPIVRYFKAL
jgi:GNAT superfamily N-acetyltransferase